jgi:hypothetical protein
MLLFEIGQPDEHSVPQSDSLQSLPDKLIVATNRGLSQAQGNRIGMALCKRLLYLSNLG